MSAESAVECPACGQSFVVEAPVEPVRVKATLVADTVVVPVPAAPVPPVPRQRIVRVIHRRKGARHEAERAKFAMVALIVGTPLVLGGLVWGAVAFGRNRQVQTDIHGTDKLLEDIRKSREAAAQKAVAEEAEWKVIMAKSRQREIDDALADVQKRQREHAAVCALIARDMFGGDLALAEEVVGEYEIAMRQAYMLWEDGIEGNEPADMDQQIEQNFLARLARNGRVIASLKGRSADAIPRVIRGGNVAGQGVKAKDPNSIEEKVKNSICGTGFWISRDGWLLTNAHVVGNATSVEMQDTADTRLSARVVKTDPGRDLALLKADCTRPVWLRLGDQDAAVGAHVFTVGFPNPRAQGVKCKTVFGDINSHTGMLDNKDHYQCSVSLEPGNSGGALVEQSSGLAVGVVFARLTASGTGEPGPQNVSYAIKPAVIRAFLQSVPEAKPLLAAVPVAAKPPDAAAAAEKAISCATDSAVLILVKPTRGTVR